MIGPGVAVVALGGDEDAGVVDEAYAGRARGPATT
jgi:hypothetical protein